MLRIAPKNIPGLLFGQIRICPSCHPRHVQSGIYLGFISDAPRYQPAEIRKTKMDVA